MESVSVSHSATVDALASQSAIRDYLSWLNRDDSPVNILVKPSADQDVIGGTFASTADAIAPIERNIGRGEPYAAIWASVHKVLPSAIGKTKVAKSDVSEYRYLAIDLDNKPTTGER